MFLGFAPLRTPGTALQQAQTRDLIQQVASRQRSPRLLGEAGELHVQTVCWRSPEVMFGDAEFTTAVDLWSLGVVAMELCREKFHWNVKDGTSFQGAFVARLGLPPASMAADWPKWVEPSKPIGTDTATRTEVERRMGPCGAELVYSLVAWVPKARPSAEQVCLHPFVRPSRFGLLAASGPAAGPPRHVFRGKRHDWAVLHGMLSTEMLHWLQGDPALDFDALKVDFAYKRSEAESVRPDVKAEFDRKFIMSGAFADCSSTAMCTLSLREKFPLARVRAWFAAFRAVNGQPFSMMAAAAAAASRRLSPDDLGSNGAAFLDTPMSQWLLTCGELAVSDPGRSDQGGCWREAVHLDGGASVLHLGLTLFGRRGLLLMEPDGETVVLRNSPGSVYLGLLTGPEHQVVHEDGSTAEHWLEKYSVTVMCRTALFAENKARLRNTTPSPAAFFHALTNSFLESIQNLEFHLPTFKEVLAAYAFESPAEGPNRTCQARPLFSGPPLPPTALERGSYLGGAGGFGIGCGWGPLRENSPQHRTHAPRLSSPSAQYGRFPKPCFARCLPSTVR